MTHKKPTDLNEFLKICKKKEGQQYTHTKIGDPNNGIWGGSYVIEGDNENTFLELYEKEVFNKNRQCYLTERHLEKGPIVIDLDFRFNGNIDKRKYDMDFIVKFISIYLEQLNSVIDVPQERMISYIMEKPDPVYKSEKDFTKDGLHIMFPHLIVSPNLQYAVRYKTITNKACKELFKSIGIINPIDDIFDICVIERNNWQMYGSGKPNCDVYKLTTILDASCNVVENNYSNKDLIRLLTVRHYNTKYNYNISEEEIGIIEEIISKIPIKHKERKSKVKKMKSPKNKKYTTDDELAMSKKLVSILNPKRAEDYSNWIQMGFCLHNIDHRLLDTWIGFSKKSDKFLEGECEKEWVYMNSDGLGIGSLCRWAKDDSVIKYNEIMKHNMYKIMLESLNCTHTDIARLVYNLLKNDYVCASISKKIWYQFRDHRWRKIDDGVTLRKYISNGLVNEYLRLESKISKESLEFEATSSDKELMIERCNKIQKVISNLKKTSFKKSILEECSELFYYERFEEKLDMNVDLVGFENGVFDLELGIFREGYPEDLLSFTTGIYYEEYNENDEEYIGVTTFMEEILPKNPVREYVITLLSSFLSGKIKEQKFHIWTGVGGNGKSKLIELFRLAFGDYCTTLPVSLITQKRGRAEGATPALANTKGKRFAALQEPEGDESINVGLMKEMTGGDTIMARNLYQNTFEFKPQFDLVLTCNVLPEIRASDRGTWRRVRAVEYESQFVEDPDPSDPFQFKIDFELDSKLSTWKEAFMFILLQEYANYKKNGIKEPYDVMKFTKEYQNESDIFSQFFDECISNNTTNGEPLYLNDTYKIYSDWFQKEKGSSNKVPRKTDFKKNMIKHYGPCSGNSWTGISIKNSTFTTDDIDC
jgi:P4 family phage/plasmid primase-like protien